MIVWPSGGACAVDSVPVMVPAPGWYSTTTGCFNASCSRVPTMCTTMSVPPPGTKGTLTRTGRLG